MIDYKLWSRRLILALGVIALVVFIDQVLRMNCWLLVSLYWFVLFLKIYMEWSMNK